MKAKDVEKAVQEIDAQVKEGVGVELEKIDRKNKIVGRMLADISWHKEIHGNEAFLVKNRIKGLVY